MTQVNATEVARQMVAQARHQPDGSGLFRGSPRRFMEIPGESCSSGALYRGLYAMGIVRRGEREHGQWLIPPGVMLALRTQTPRG